MMDGFMKNPIVITVLTSLALMNAVVADESNLDLLPRCQSFYSGRESELTVRGAVAREKLSWNLRYAGRTLAAGEGVVSADGQFKIRFNFPKLNPGVVAATEFSAYSGEVRIRKVLHFYYPNPFAGNKEQLKKLKIAVWQADEEDKLAVLLKSHDVPFKEISDIANFPGDVLLITGLDFAEYSGLAEELYKLAKTGKRIIVIPPLQGTFPLPGVAAEKIRLGKNQIINEYGKRFDTDAWSGKPVSQKSFKTVPYDDGVALEVVDSTEGFTFCEINHGKGSMIIMT